MLLEQSGITIPEPRHYDVYVAALGAEARIPALKLTTGLRRAGVKSEMDHAGRSLKAQFKQADKHNAELCVVIGPDEVAAGTATIRDMKTHEQTSVAMAELASAVAERLA